MLIARRQTVFVWYSLECGLNPCRATLDRDLLSSGSGVLDIAGGRGAVAFELGAVLGIRRVYSIASIEVQLRTVTTAVLSSGLY